MSQQTNEPVDELSIDIGNSGERWTWFCGTVRAAERLGFRVELVEWRNGVDDVYGIRAKIYATEKSRRIGAGEQE